MRWNDKTNRTKVKDVSFPCNVKRQRKFSLRFPLMIHSHRFGDVSPSKTIDYRYAFAGPWDCIERLSEKVISLDRLSIGTDFAFSSGKQPGCGLRGP